ncbi:Nin one binding Zn-ribbon like-domain-containing protein [Hygrophoropsis aurantiaca]|uniref:Nin one binding Zn-ribbon like-domain-containing protein n=1 Tax=Hygrophoropsis aurantiaca TaxID=72124 RepID=A0ACB8ASS8_9AGAM|nr:Nin one binding Zn-ribbon like-domain-containing protein [Hygrophoropsis aurantiaca]
MSETKPRCKNLVLDSGPLLSLSPLRGLAETYLTVPQVLEELKDKRAREHFERLGLSAGVRVDIQNPDAASLAHVIQFAKNTGDYSVLSHADICVLALTHSLHDYSDEIQKPSSSNNQSSATQLGGNVSEVPEDTLERNVVEEESENPDESQEIHQKNEISVAVDADIITSDDTSKPTAIDAPQSIDEVEDVIDQEREPLDVELHREEENDHMDASDPPTSLATDSASDTLFEDPSDEDDGEGEWITPQNVALHKSRALDLLPSDGGTGKTNGKGKDDEIVQAGCMTADFAMQNVLLQMGLPLVGTEGKRIQKVKSWVLRCHACFKICKDNSKQFCPSCGNPTLMRASVTITAPGASADSPVMQIHLKKNFQYKMRGTKYSIPAPKPGSAKTGPGEGLILREDQLDYMRAKKRVDGKRDREEQKMIKGLVTKGGEGGVSVGSWTDPDWMPEILSVGTGGKGRTVGKAGEMPKIGHGRQNPNERRGKK